MKHVRKNWVKPRLFYGAAASGLLGVVLASGSPYAAESTAQAMRSQSIEEIVVSAQKREERLQDVPVPVTALDAGALTDGNQVRLQDYYTKVPGLNMVPGSSSSTYGVISIRGITTGGVNNPTVGVTIDDVPYGSSTGLGGGTSIPDLDPSDLKRIEVLRGPQGTLYGASSMGGLIKFVTVDPQTTQFSGRLESGISGVHNGSEPGYVVRGSANIPVSEEMAFRVSGFNRRDPGYIDNPVNNTKGVNEQRVSGGRIAGLWTPTENFSAKISALYQDFTSDGLNASTPGLGDLQQNYVRGIGQNNGTIQAYSATLAGKAGIFDITSITGYNARRFYFTDDFSPLFGAAVQGLYPGVSGASIETEQKNKKFTQEVRASASLGTDIDVLLGGFYTHEKSPARQDIVAINQATGAAVATVYQSTFPTKFTEYATFANVTWRATERLDIQLGGRASWIRQTTLPGLTIPTLFGSSTPSFSPETRSRANPMTFQATPRFKLSTDHMVYSRIATGYRAGGSNVQTCITFATFPCQFGSDKTYNYEVGAKGNFLDGMISYDTSLYYIDWRGIQLQARDNVNQVSYNTNAGRAKSQGLELAVETRPLEGLVVAASGAWNLADLKQPFPATSPVRGAPGDRLPHNPRFSGNISVDQSVPIGDVIASLGATVSYVGGRIGVFQAAGAPRQYMPSYTKMDLRTGLKYDLWSANIYANNVFDKRGVLQGPMDLYPSAYFYIQPRTVGINVARNF